MLIPIPESVTLVGIALMDADATMVPLRVCLVLPVPTTVLIREDMPPASLEPFSAAVAAADATMGPIMVPLRVRLAPPLESVPGLAGMIVPLRVLLVALRATTIGSSESLCSAA